MGYLVAAAIVISLASAAASAYAQHEAGEAQAKGFRYQARDAENRALASRQAAAVRERQQRERTDRIRATARSRAAASGVDPGEGSPLLVMMENARQAELDASLIRYAGATQSAFLESESKLKTFQGGAARRAANIGAGATLLEGVSSAVGIYARTRTPSSPYAKGSAWGTTGGTGGEG